MKNIKHKDTKRKIIVGFWEQIIRGWSKLLSVITLWCVHACVHVFVSVRACVRACVRSVVKVWCHQRFLSFSFRRSNSCVKLIGQEKIDGRETNYCLYMWMKALK